jgi:hypothetical protein
VYSESAAVVVVKGATACGLQCREEVRISKEAAAACLLCARAEDRGEKIEVSVVAAGCVCAARRKIQRDRGGEVVKRCS